MILAIKTDTFDAELYILDIQGTVVDSVVWHAGRELSVEILATINKLLDDNVKLLQDIKGVVVYQGPGSFTGLRIGIAVANALAYGLSLPIVATTSGDWILKGMQQLKVKKHFEPVQPLYGADPHITTPRK